MAQAKSQEGDIWLRLASGIEAGIVGGLAMLALAISASLWDGRVWWESPNLLGSTFYGIRAFRAGPGMATLSGVALHFVITGTLGGLFGLLFGGIQERGRLVILGLLASVGWYNLASTTVWPKLNPWVLVASPRPVTVVSHVLLGACLGYMGQRQRMVTPQESRNLIPAPPIQPIQPESYSLAPALAGPLDPPFLAGIDTEAATELSPMPDAADGLAIQQTAIAEVSAVSDRGQSPAAASSDALE